MHLRFFGIKQTTTMSALFLLILLAVLALALWLGYLGYRAMTGRKTPAEPVEPPGVHHRSPKSTAEKKARGQT